MKIVKRIFTIFIIVLFAAAVLPWVVFPALNDIRAGQLKQELKSTPLPQNTEIIEALSGCGNTGGTGNHTETWAAILIKTELSEKDILKFYGEDVHKVDATNKETFIMRLLNEEFSSLKGISSYDGYYIIERTGTPVSSFFDIRGN